jgi:hypothetical protein
MPHLIYAEHRGMSELELDDGVRALLESRLDSIEKLEIACALRASGGMTPAALEAACRLSAETVQDALTRLQRDAIVEPDPGRSEVVRLGSASQDPGFEAVMQLYATDRLRVLSVLSALAMERIRHMAAQVFADAFVSKKRRGDDT